MTEGIGYISTCTITGKEVWMSHVGGRQCIIDGVDMPDLPRKPVEEFSTSDDVFDHLWEGYNLLLGC